MGQVDDRVVEITICDRSDGTVEVTVVAIDDLGRAVVEVECGEAGTVRSQVRMLAARYDLVPEWRDGSWIRSGERPPASRYVVR